MITLQEVNELAKSYKCIPISSEILADIKTPIEVLKILKNVSTHCYMLESVENQEKWGRYTFLGFEPTLEISCKDGLVTVKRIAGAADKNADYKIECDKIKGDNVNTAENMITVMQEQSNPKAVIKRIIENYKSPKLEGLPSFTGGLVGYFSYDYMKYSEPGLKLDADDEEGFKDVDLMLFDKVIVFDNVKQKIIVIVNAIAGSQSSFERATSECSEYDNSKNSDITQEYERAVDEINRIISLIKNGKPIKEISGKRTSDYRKLFEKDEYCKMVERAKKYIYEGDIFQVVLSNRLEADFEGSLLNAYRVLRTTNPSPYMFYFSSDDIEVAGASPETLVKLEDGVLHTFPLAGTRPRGKDEAEDKRLEAELLSDEKELAEHNMLVDLGRNDLGKISRFGSVNVEKYMSIERYSHVMHIGSTVRGEIREDKCALDAVDAVLPAGTLSGAPKIRAMQIINELENNKRGIYGGAIGYIDFAGNLDTCIAIRIAFKKNGKVFVRMGAGIVADSIPENEYQECINKAKAVMNALEDGAKEL